MDQPIFQVTTIIYKTRVVHDCYWCAQPVAPGSKATMKTRGERYSVLSHLYLHDDCASASDRDPCTIEEEFCPYVHRRGLTCAETTP